MSIKITCTHRYDDLLALKDEWETLHARSRNSSVFFSWEWITAYWKHLGGEDELWLLLARDDSGRLLGIAPLQRRTRTVRGPLRWASLEFIAEPLGATHADFIIEAGQEAPVLDAFFAWLDGHRAWLEIQLIGVPEESPTCAILQNGPLTWELLESRECPFIALPQDWDSYYDALGKHKRKNQRAYRRKLDAAFPGQWTVEQVLDPEAVRHAIDLVMDWHQEKWTSRDAPGNFFNDQLRAFHHEIAQRFLQRGWLWLFQATVNGAVVCVDYNFSFMGRIFAIAGGTDPSYLSYCVNCMVIEHILRQAIDQHLKEFDFLWGDHEYKMRWGCVVRCDQVFAHAIGLQPRLYRRTMRHGRTVWRKVKRLLPDGARQKLRRTVRKALRSSH